MKRLILSLLAISALFSAQAQYSFDPVQHLDSTLETSDYHSLYVYFEPPSPRAITYKWTAISNTIPNDWSYSLCDRGGCYAGIPDSGTMGAISMQEAQNGAKGFFNLTVNPDDVTGIGEVALYFYDQNNPNDGDTVYYTVSHTSTVGLENPVASEVSAYPNPAKDNLQLVNSGELNLTYSLMDLNGRVILSGSLDAESNNNLDVSSLSAGMYIINYQNNNELIQEKIQIVH